MKRRTRKKSAVPIMLLWSKRDQLRFIDAVEKFTSLVNDLETIVMKAKAPRRTKASSKVAPAADHAANNGKED